MKASDLRSVIRKMVKEELKQLLPEMLSEMYVRKLVAESAPPRPTAPARQTTPARAAQQPKRSSLARQLMEEFDSTDWYAQGSQEEPVVEAPRVNPVALEQRKAALAEANPMLAAMITEETVESLGETDPMEKATALEAVPFDFERMRKIANLAESKAPAGPAKTAHSEEQRIMLQRQRLENMKVS